MFTFQNKNMHVSFLLGLLQNRSKSDKKQNKTIIQKDFKIAAQRHFLTYPLFLLTNPGSRTDQLLCV